MHVDRNSCLLYAKRLADVSSHFRDLALCSIAMIQDRARDLEGLRLTFHEITVTKKIVQPYLIHNLVREHLLQEAFALADSLVWRGTRLEGQTIRAISAVRDFSTLPSNQNPCVQAGLILAYTHANQEAEAERLLETLSPLNLQVFVHVERLRIKRDRKQLLQSSKIAQEIADLIEQLPTEKEKCQAVEWLAIMYAETGDCQTALDLLSGPSDENSCPTQKEEPAGVKYVRALQAEEGLSDVEGDPSSIVRSFSKRGEFRKAIQKIGLISSSREKDYARLMIIEDLVKEMKLKDAKRQASQILATHIQAVAWACIAYAIPNSV